MGFPSGWGDRHPSAYSPYHPWGEPCHCPNAPTCACSAPAREPHGPDLSSLAGFTSAPSPVPNPTEPSPGLGHGEGTEAAQLSGEARACSRRLGPAPPVRCESGSTGLQVGRAEGHRPAPAVLASEDVCPLPRGLGAAGPASWPARGSPSQARSQEGGRGPAKVHGGLGSRGHLGTRLLPWLIGGRDHHCVADGERNEEVENVGQLRRQVGQRALLVPCDGQAPVTLAHFLKQLWVGRDIFLLEENRGQGLSPTPRPAKGLGGWLFEAPGSHHTP